VERPSERVEREVFEHYMRMDPSQPDGRGFMEDHCRELAGRMLLSAQYLELLSAKLREGGE
jgi:hypothetical protein